MVNHLAVRATLMMTLMAVIAFGQKKKAEFIPSANELENQCFAKGGLGIITTELYINVKSARNELSLDKGKRWQGKLATSPEVVVYFDHGVGTTDSLPKAFDMSKAILISFEIDQVRFFDFKKMSGCYYNRLKPQIH